MGLDDFKTGEDKEKSDESVDGKVIPIFEKKEQEQEEKQQETGLMSFKTDSDQQKTDNSLDRDKSNPWMDDFTAQEWNDMSTKEKVKYVRHNHWPGYRPDVDLSREWSTRHVVEINCVCGNTFTFRTGGTCMDCGRGYKYTGDVVIKKHDPHNNLAEQDFSTSEQKSENYELDELNTGDNYE